MANFMDQEDVQIEIEPDETDFVEDQGGFQEKIVPEPESGAAIFAAASDFLSLYGWYILLAGIGLWYLKNRYSSQLNEWQNQRTRQSDANRYSQSEILDRQEGIERARRRLQDEHDQKAKEFAEKQKLKEEEKRQAEIEDWDRHQQGRGYKSKKKVDEDFYPKQEPSSSKPKPKRPLREGYNPLMGADVGNRPRRVTFNRGGG